VPLSRITFKVEENFDFNLEKKTNVKNWLKKVAQKEGKTVGNISYLFCTDEYLLQVNRQFLNHDFYTDIITFDYSEKKKIEGEIFVSIDRVKENAVKFKQPFQKELMRTIVHGVLHLCGYKDKNRADEKTMRMKEEEALQMPN
jgi:probable rRNA maturation factor